MKIEQLEYIVEVAKLGSLSLTSRKLHITQSAISQAITSLEEELGVKIFKRSRLGTTPTDRGNKIIKKALETLEKLEELRMETDMNLNLVDGKLRVGTIPSPLMYLPKTLSAFKKDYPNMRIEISEKASQDIVENIKQDQLDIGLIGLSMEGEEMRDQNIAFEVVLRGQMIVAASINSPLAFASAVTPQEIRRHPLVIYNDDRMWEFVNNLTARFGPVDVLFSTNNQDAIRNAVIENLAITIAPDYTVISDSNVVNGKVVPVEISNLEQNYPGMALVWSKTKRNTTIIRNFVSRLTLDMIELKNHS
ncbi:LysR family transcriptional regulator [Lentibacillus sp. CBA3610]|uniref:LysR family transcriptional regulator n=1 Tax=Lentibacillus sp. CBA3610 TaxID=2518176 RepID=UPI0015955338|nr:LysR family transcriptional regulator [Lentibacillus sp. CBA3610]QKY68743.1 LysR family transcriptional regulator [Lentibacillus sp. CBA3610]